MFLLMKRCCIQSRKLNAGCELEYIKPIKGSNGRVYASISKTMIDDNVNRWANTLVGYVIGHKPFYIHLK